MLQSFEALGPLADGVEFVRDGATCGLQLLQSHAEFFDGQKAIGRQLLVPGAHAVGLGLDNGKGGHLHAGQGEALSSQLTSATRIASQTTVSYEPTTQTATLDPYGSTTSRLAKCQRYTAKLTSRVKHKAGNPAITRMRP